MQVGPNVICIDAFPVSRQHAAWLDALAPLGLRCELRDGQLPTGELGIITSRHGSRLARLRSSAQRLAGAPHGAGGGHEPLLVTFHADGRGTLRGGAESREFAEGDVSVADRAQAFSFEQRTGFELLMLEIPRERVFMRLGRTTTRLPLVLGETVAASAVRPLMRTLALHFDQVQEPDLVSVELAVTELVTGALLREGRNGDGGSTQNQAAHFRRVTSAVELRLMDPDLSMSTIAPQTALSQRYIQKLFELQDTTFSDYVRLRRLDRARIELADPRHGADSVAEVGFRWGFRDPAHFSRAFSAAYGVSPRTFRTGASATSRNLLRRGRPREKDVPHNAIVARDAFRETGTWEHPALIAGPRTRGLERRIAVGPDTVHWGYLSRSLAPALRVESGSEVVIETLTQHATDDHARMIEGDAAAESVFAWTREGKNVARRGAGPMNASILGRGAGEGFGVHIFTGPVFINGAEPGDVLEVQILDIVPRPSMNPDFAGRCFASNVSAWWGYQYSDLLDDPKPRETVTIYEMDRDGEHAHALYRYRWTPQVDPSGVRHDTMDYPGVPVDRSAIEECWDVLPDVRVPLRPHFGCMAVAPREADLVDSIPPGYFGGNFDNWRAGKGSTLYLPVAVPGALFSVGDGHLAQGDGEINGTGLEASLTGTFRFILHKRDESKKAFLNGLHGPLLETADHFILHGFSYPNYLRDLGRDAQSEIYKKSSLSKALRSAFRSTRKFLMDYRGLDEDEALSLISVAVDFGVTQVADGNWGVHAIIRKSLFARD
ncbi:acetamidase/formamidase family protein [Terrihabitans rhizophilus]|uniref:Acetamidase/formamidase family protein n=1 Tax=Terrihabitans rhizophilus TaxID=3092662 RepID=A0ABU4RKT3_9HYPH|nr:acetamidase/formamidase family protein [Terrihabitans sp. PJ23]MDX6804823.1 acetamidase/formamidase family protein [Terrihabitans sp. PJ23]